LLTTAGSAWSVWLGIELVRKHQINALSAVALA